VNGSGKTTSIAKLTNLFSLAGQEGRARRRRHVPRRRRVAAHDLGRPPRTEIVKVENQGDPAAVAHKAVARALESQAEICIIDTAGRLQTQTNLMQQLEKIHRVITKLIPAAPHETLLVLDATAGQNAPQPGTGIPRPPLSAPGSCWPSSTARPRAGVICDPREIRHPRQIRRPGEKASGPGRVQSPINSRGPVAGAA